MKITDYMCPMVYHPRLRRAAGSFTATIFLSLILNEGRIGDWIEISVKRAEEVTGLTYEEQKTARAKLVKRGIIMEKYDRMKHDLMFVVLADGLNDACS